MGRISAILPEDLDQRLRAEISRRLGFKKGNIQLAIIEALENWIAKANPRGEEEEEGGRDDVSD